MRYTASSSFRARADRFCADHHCWMLSLPGTGLWHKLQSFLHATVTFLMMGTVRKSIRCTLSPVYFSSKCFWAILRPMSNVGLPFKTSLFCFFLCYYSPIKPPSLLFFMSKQVQDSSFSRYKCSFGRSQG